ncbi:D-alanyl-D-alanine carboxypeptidase family protein [Solimonas sp. SE-A11]|uniref:D-alanyl-D-alanine carboxypeptidase family protein n=1 Tax=Solimonas sp. SE-A11 TaxID=3054954 RepID=UPI00259C9CCE|nr:serine hydrolase [Solimonas sp. SE-A11]MDM4768575.1 serine hydrolase [Solimonas sp. SE-A11]
MAHLPLPDATRRLLLLGLLAGAWPAAHAAPLAAVEAQAWLLMRDGELLGEHDADAPRPMASLTKMMTALLVLESGRSLDEVVAVPAAAARDTGTRLRLRAGERMRLGDLLAAAVVASANDACQALALVVGGSGTAFVRRMNARAAALGLKQTRFTNPCGHDAPGHFSTARELAALALTVMRDPRYRVLAATSQTTISSRDTTPRRFTLSNRNELVGRHPGVVGVKSGTTPNAGRCLAAFAMRGEHSALLVMLDARERWWTAGALLDRALDGDAPAR